MSSSKSEYAELNEGGTKGSSAPPPYDYSFSSYAKRAAPPSPGLAARGWPAESPFSEDDASHSDVPEDFLLGVDTASAHIAVRMAFVRKVYSILTAQLALTAVVGAIFMSSEKIQLWAYTNMWLFWVSFVGTLITLIALHFKRRETPTNYVLLSVFTALEAYTIGMLVSAYDQMIVLEAVLLTLFVFVGLTLYSMQTKRDFIGMGPYLFGALWLLVISSFFFIFFPVNQLIIATPSALIFSLYIVYDTQNLIKRLSPEDYIIAAIELYLDIINLFIAILRILDAMRRN